MYTSIEEMVKHYYKPTLFDLMQLVDVGENQRDWGWILLVNWRLKKWKIPLLPVVSERSTELRKALPHLSDREINDILRECNEALRALRRAEFDDPEIINKPRGK